MGTTKTTVDWSHEFDFLPNTWALTPVKQKRPLRPSWQSEQPIAREILLGLLESGQTLKNKQGKNYHCEWTGVGLRLGKISGGLLAVDLDGPSAQPKLDELSGGDIPDTVSWTSGKEGRKQLLYQIPEEWIEKISTVKLTTGADEYLEFRWDGLQSVLPPSIHPDTGRYRWLKDPISTSVATAPRWMLDFIVEQVRPALSPVERIQRTYYSTLNENQWEDRDWALSYLDALAPWRADDYQCWVNVGMALHSIDENLLEIWDRWSSISPKYKPGQCEQKWKSFKPGRISTGTLGHYAKEDGWTNPFIQDVQDHTPPPVDMTSFLPSLPSQKDITSSPLSSPSLPSDSKKNSQLTQDTSKAERSYHKSLPPHLLDAEAEVLRLMLTGLCKELEVFGVITTPDVFYDPKHRVVYEAMLKLHELGMPSNLISVLDALQNNGKLSSIGGREFLLSLTYYESNYSRGESVESTARMLVDKWIRRELLQASVDVTALGFNQTLPLDSVLDESEKLIYRLRNLTPNKTTLHNSEVANRAYEKLNNPNNIYYTGYPALDSLLVGVESETLTVLAARSSMGKTAFAIQTLLQAALNHGKHCAYFSLEMTAEQLEYRLWCLMSNHPHYANYNLTPFKSNRIREHMSGRRPFTVEEQGNLAAIAALSTELNLSLNDSRNITPSGIGSECRKLKSQYDNEMGLVIIDYLQLFGGDSSSSAETSNKLMSVTRYFYNLAQELNCPIMLLAQINRGPEGRNDKRPTMSDLAQSGGVEWIADNILMLYREGYYSTENPDDPTLEVICRKARQGATGTAKMCFDPERFLVYQSTY